MRASTSDRASSAYTFSFEPKPPPTSGATIRSFCSPIPVTPDSVNRAMWGICVEEYSVYSPIDGTPIASVPRGSIGLGVIRGAT